MSVLMEPGQIISVEPEESKRGSDSHLCGFDMFNERPDLNDQSFTSFVTNKSAADC